MIFDASVKKPDPNKTYDICIVGTGATGLAMANAFIANKKSVVVLESSIANVRKSPRPDWHHRYDDDDVQPIYGGEMNTAAKDTIANAWEFLLSSRIRCYGGTTNCWEGWTQPLSDLDFDRSGLDPNLCKWPIKPREMDFYYNHAMAYCSVGLLDATSYGKPGLWIDQAKRYGGTVIELLSLLPGPANLESRAILQIGGRDDSKRDPLTDGGWDFQWVWGRYVEKDPDVTIYRNANVRRVVSKDGGKSVDHLEVSTTRNKRPGDNFTVKAKNFVLAASCVENARLLLHSAGTGIDGGPALGRYLMTHPLIKRAATFKWVKGKISDGVDHFYLGSGPTIARTDIHPNVFAVLVPNPQEVQSRSYGNFRAWFGFEREAVNFCCEQLPYAGNRVEIFPDRLKDPVFDDPAASVTLSLQPKDWTTIANGIDLVKRVMQDNNKYITDFSSKYLNDKSPKTEDEMVLLTGQHAMGSTRMSDNPQYGVVNKDCRMHKVNNLYLAGGSVFPTGGWANPTLTMIALALRLAEHLGAKLD